MIHVFHVCGTHSSSQTLLNSSTRAIALRLGLPSAYQLDPDVSVLVLDNYRFVGLVAFKGLNDFVECPCVAPLCYSVYLCCQLVQ